MLKEMSIPSYLGESKPWGNVGSMKNEGVELELGYKFNKGDWNFGISANASYLKNELINLGNADGFEMYDNVHQVGNVSVRKTECHILISMVIKQTVSSRTRSRLMLM